MAFAQNALKKLVWASYDKFHRVIRDIKLALQHAASGCYLRAQLFTSHLFSLNYKPFGTGGFYRKKQRLLELFLAQESIASPLFLKYWERIAADFGVPAVDESDKERQSPQVGKMVCMERMLREQPSGVPRTNDAAGVLQ